MTDFHECPKRLVVIVLLVVSVLESSRCDAFYMARRTTPKTTPSSPSHHCQQHHHHQQQQHQHQHQQQPSYGQQTVLSRASSSTTLAATNAKDGQEGTPANVEKLFQSAGWKPIQANLDRLPLFTCANPEGQPLAYTIERINSETGEKEVYTVPFFYCDVDDALEELAKVQKATSTTTITTTELKGDDDNNKRAGLDLIPFPLGKAFQMWATDQAVIVPNQRAIVQAGAPPNSNPVGQHVPLFCCMELMQSSSSSQSSSPKSEDPRDDDDNAPPVLPLFMTKEEANAAVAEAVQLSGGTTTVDELEVVSLSLNRAVTLLALSPEDTPAFQFIPPKKSLQFIAEYLSG
jgi:hypothetical protein